MNNIYKIFLSKPFYPAHSEELMANEENLNNTRDDFLKKRFRNLHFLLSKRYGWMNEFLNDKQDIIEVGSGAGFSKFYLNHKIILTDAIQYPWIDQKVDALKLPYKENSIDVIIASHAIHHFSSPILFFKECSRVLRVNGLVIIQEINTSLLVRLIIKLMKIEGYSYDIDIFDTKMIANDPKEPWSANNAIPELLFTNENYFEKNLPSFKIIKNDINECLIFLCSGGVTRKIKIPELSNIILKMLHIIDKILIFIAPNIFGMGRSVVLKMSLNE